MIPTGGTAVTYPAGAIASRSTVVHVADAGDGRRAVVLDETAFHPVDTAWPDQPADRGTLSVDGADLTVIAAVVGALPVDASPADRLLLGAEVPVRTGTEGWTFVVAHVVDGEAPIAEGDAVEVTVDAAYRVALSAGHTACHLASLALDAALAGAWRKDAPADALGSPAFDALAIQESRIVADGSVDVYRIGKSLRRKGFDPEALADLDALAARVDAQLAQWLAAGGAVRIERDGDALADRRTWVCDLPGGAARIPCGGTHVASLEELSAATVSFAATTVEGGIELVMTTTATRAEAP
ncbi:metal-dependent hydrolase [Microbacterium sp. QXD-8]|uniref:Metal-dependent hydrolase n=1 Tax=Microbacterium psychrotolerans TaxID=3068321 RepID=A0ABU0Z2N0_9MICO|nr:metal-dependent hydrolase [Microbacterium sp. QXD-8]MDQ7878847.1 metal-dependent hydrolase [Microbacterium sp. QXD-8]